MLELGSWVWDLRGLRFPLLSSTRNGNWQGSRIEGKYFIIHCFIRFYFWTIRMHYLLKKSTLLKLLKTLSPSSTAPYSHSKINPPDTQLWSCYTRPVRILGRAQTLSSVTAKALYDPGSTHPPYYSSNIPLLHHLSPVKIYYLLLSQQSPHLGWSTHNQSSFGKPRVNHSFVAPPLLPTQGNRPLDPLTNRSW